MASVAPQIPALARDQAFEHLYRLYVKDVYHYALALLRNPADAEDVTQTTFMNAYRAYTRGERPIKAQNWLIKIAHNAARSRHARAGRRVKEVPLDDHLEQLAVPDAEKPDIRAVLDALGRLPLNQRAALVMRELEGRTYAEIADTLGVSVAAVETLVFRGRRALRLKASTIRVLTAVPVPTSLAQLFDAGGVVVGGGALVGSGFLLKAAVAIIAGVVATGVGGGDHTRGANAAGRHLAQEFRSEKSGGPTRTASRAASVRTPVGLARHDRVGNAGRTTRRGWPFVVEGANAASTPGADGQASATRTSAAPKQQVATTTPQVTDTVGTAVDTVTTSVPVTPPVAVPELPPPPAVQVPQLPTLQPLP